MHGSEHEYAVIGLIKLGSSIIASASGDGAIMIWDIEKGDCIKVLKQKLRGCDSVKQIINLPQENLFLTLTSDGIITRWDMNTGDSQHCWIDKIVFVRVLSEEQLLLIYEGSLAVASISTLFDGTFDDTALNLVPCPAKDSYGRGRYFYDVCVLPNGYIACLTGNSRWWTFDSRDLFREGTFVIYNLNRAKIVFEQQQVPYGANAGLRLLPNQQIAICHREMSILTFSLKKMNLVTPKEPAENKRDQNCVIS